MPASSLQGMIPMKAACLMIVLALLGAGCARPAAQPPAVTTSSADIIIGTPAPEEPDIVTARRYESTKIQITYHGGPDADRLIELQTTVITNVGSVNIQSMGSRADTTPVQVGGTDLFQGPYPDTVHVTTTAYYANGSHRGVLDTRI